MRKLSGTRRFNGKNFKLMGTIGNKRTASQVAQVIRDRTNASIQKGRKYSYNARVIPIKSRNGYGVYVQRKSRAYNFTNPPWRNFQDGRSMVDTVLLNDWLKQQIGHNPNLSWRENLRNISGPQALVDLERLSDPVNAMIEDAQKAEASFDFNSMLDDLLADTELGQDAGFEAKSRDEYKTEMGGGFSDEFLMLTGPEEQRALVATEMQDADVFDFLDIDDGVTPRDDTEFLAELDAWFDREFEQEKLLPQNVGETIVDTKNTLAVLAQNELLEKDGESLDDALDRILGESFDELLRNEITDDKGKMTFGDRMLSPEDIFSDATLNPGLGFAQPNVPAGSQAGYWTYRPLGNLGTSVSDAELFAKKDAFLIVDSVGNIVSSEFYERGNGSEERAAVRAASNTAKLLTAQFDQYKSDGFSEYGRTAPGLALIDGTVTIDREGNWAGYDILGRQDDYTLTAGDFEYYVDGQEVAQGGVPASVLRNWILPQTRAEYVDSARERAEFLGVDFDGAKNANTLAMAELARQEGASASMVNDLLNNTKYRIYDGDGAAVSTTLPDWETTLKVIRDFSSSGRTENFVISKSKSDGLGNVSRLDERIYANALFDPTIGYVFNYIDNEPSTVEV